MMIECMLTGEKGLPDSALKRFARLYICMTDARGEQYGKRPATRKQGNEKTQEKQRSRSTGRLYHPIKTEPATEKQALNKHGLN